MQILGALAFLPKLLSSSSRGVILQYLGFALPPKRTENGPCFLFYAVSVGETKAVSPLFAKMRDLYPNASFYVASRTKTGHEEAKASLPGAACYFFLPVDFSWVMRSLIKRINPTAIVVVESDLWYNFLKVGKEAGAAIILVNGRISSRSYKRFLLFSKLAKKLFSLFDLILAQNSQFAKRFVDLGVDASKVLVSGNLKEAALLKGLSKEEKLALRRKLGITEAAFVIVLASTHSPEEKEVLEALKPLWASIPGAKILLVPRHPERFFSVGKLLQASSLPYISLSNIQDKTGDEKVILIDAMGVLLDLYQIADLAVVCGSFNRNLKGHNILEPIQAGIPVFFGPYMEDQQDFVSQVLFFNAGRQTELSKLLEDIKLFFNSPNLLKESGKHLLSSYKDSVKISLDAIEKFI